MMSYTGFPERSVAATCRWILSTWFPELQSRPALSLLGPDTNAGRQLFGLLSGWSRHSLQLTEVNAAGLRGLPMKWGLTLLIQQQKLGADVQHMLNTAGKSVGFVPRGGRLFDPRCCVATYTESIAACGSNRIPSLEISAVSARQDLPVFDDAVRQKIASDFQPKLLDYRLANFSKVQKSMFDAPTFAPSMRELAKNLAAYTPDDPDLQTQVLELLRVQDREVRSAAWLDLNVVIVEAILGLEHEGKQDSLYVGEITEAAETILITRGENRKLEPRAVGARLGLLDLITEPRDSQGIRLLLTPDISRHVHQLASDFFVPSIQGGRMRCQFCRPAPPRAISRSDGGITINDPDTNGNLIAGNYIGTDVNGTAALANAWSGVVPQQRAPRRTGRGHRRQRRGPRRRTAISFPATINKAWRSSASEGRRRTWWRATTSARTRRHRRSPRQLLRRASRSSLGDGEPVGGMPPAKATTSPVTVQRFVRMMPTRSLQATSFWATTSAPTRRGRKPSATTTRASGSPSAHRTTASAAPWSASHLPGNGLRGVAIGDPGTSGNVVAGNYVGTDAAGTHALGIGYDGIFIYGGAKGNRIGSDDGSAAGRNVIAGNGYRGIWLTGVATDGNLVRGNFLGTDATGPGPAQRRQRRRGEQRARGHGHRPQPDRQRRLRGGRVWQRFAAGLYLAGRGRRQWPFLRGDLVCDLGPGTGHRGGSAGPATRPASPARRSRTSSTTRSWPTSPSPTMPCGIGLSDAASEGTFTWSTGEPLAYTNWHAGEPNNPGGNENNTLLNWIPPAARGCGTTPSAERTHMPCSSSTAPPTFNS